MDLFLTILLGIAANIITPYIKKVFSVLMNKVSLRWENRNEKRKAILKDKVKVISNNNHEEIMLAMKVNRDFLYGLFFILLGAILIGLSIASKTPEKIHTITGSLILLYGASHFSANQDITILQEVTRNRKMEKQLTGTSYNFDTKITIDTGKSTLDRSISRSDINLDNQHLDSSEYLP